jgi:hypothetical protein
VEVWGVSRQDSELGEPIGRRYMQNLVNFSATRRSRMISQTPAVTRWPARRVGIRLDDLLRDRDAWFAAIQELVNRIRQIEQSQDDGAS